MVEKEDPELTSTHEYTKIKITYRATIYENDLKMSRKDSPQLKTKKEPHRWLGGADMQCSQDPHPRLTTHLWREYHNPRGPPQGVRGPAPHQAPQYQRSYTGKMSPPEQLALKTSGLTFRRA